MIPSYSTSIFFFCQNCLGSFPRILWYDTVQCFVLVYIKAYKTGAAASWSTLCWAILNGSTMQNRLEKRCSPTQYFLSWHDDRHTRMQKIQAWKINEKIVHTCVCTYFCCQYKKCCATEHWITLDFLHVSCGAVFQNLQRVVRHRAKLICTIYTI